MSHIHISKHQTVLFMFAVLVVAEIAWATWHWHHAQDGLPLYVAIASFLKERWLHA